MAVFVLLFFFLVFIVLAVFLYEKGIKSSENQPGQVSPGSRKGSSSGGISAATSEKIDPRLLALLEEEKAVRKKIDDYKRKMLEENLDPLYLMENDPESEYEYLD